MSQVINDTEDDSENIESHQSSNQEHRLPKAELFDILSANRRQEVLRYLDTVEEKATIGDLAEHIASLECDCDKAQLSSQQRKRTYVGLYQCHLPKMADAGVIEYNRNRGTIAKSERSDRLLKYLYLEEENEGESEGIVKRLFG